MIAKVALGTVFALLVAANSALAESGGQTILLNQIGALQQEVMELRGLTEQQANTMEQIQKEGRDRYLDLDRRIIQLSEQLRSAAGLSTIVDSSADSATDAKNTSANPVATIAKGADEIDYQKAFQAVQQRRFSDAANGLSTYLQKYPEGEYADNAQYWLGEIYLLQESFDRAELAFSHLIKRFPKSDKRSDALYKLGQVNDRLGNDTKAKTYLQRVIKEYPNTASARLADVYLGNLEG